MKELHAMVVLGTRPESIKLAPVVHELDRRGPGVRASVVNTGQHREMLAPMLSLFGIDPAHDLALQRPDQTLEHVVSGVLTGMASLFERNRPDVVVVQGDTATTFAAALASFFRHVPVAHVEAGLRTDDPRIPFPEEMNRRLTSRIADLHCAPTARARDALLAEGVREDTVLLTGNTVVDALQWLRRERGDEVSRAADEALSGIEVDGRRLVVITGHRRESFGQPFRDFCTALKDASEEHPDLVLVYPVHLNPKVQAPVREILSGTDRIHLLPPVDYPAMIGLLERATVVVTDSGGIQEEAPSFGVPVLVTRETTERPEGVDSGVATLVGTDPRRIRAALREALNATAKRVDENPYGDGHAARRTVDALVERFGRG
jgi:UDP-N-acetylglucosamine 2-epimerase (hydrolysing)